MIKIHLSRLAKIIGSALENPLAVEGVAVDSRLVLPGNVFFALEGDRADGHEFIGEAAKKGASAAVVCHRYAGSDFGIPLLRVESGLNALQQLAQKFLEERHIRILAITGSVGKTTTKDFISHILKQRYRITATLGNANSQVGLPLTVLNQIKGDEEWLVLEMGMSCPGQIANLVNIAPPHIAVITSIGLVHAVNFSSLEEIARAKGEIFSHPTTEWGVFPAELPFADAIRQFGTCRKVIFSLLSKHADFVLEASGKDSLQIQNKGHIFEMGELSVPGKHNQQNFLCAAAAARLAGVEWEDIREAMKDMQLPERRLQFTEHAGVVYINDSYNASVLSVKAALDSLPNPAGGRRIAVLGDMLELGKFSEDCHYEVGLAAQQSADALFCLGAEMRAAVEAWRFTREGAFSFSERADLVNALREYIKPKDVVLIKGSRGMQMWKVIEDLCQKHIFE